MRIRSESARAVEVEAELGRSRKIKLPRSAAEEKLEPNGVGWVALSSKETD